MKLKTYEKYISKEHGKIFALVLSALASIYMLVVFLEILDDVLEKKAPVIYALQATLFKLPFGIKEIGATSILISVIIFMSILSKNLEPIILNSLGVPVTKIIKPLILQALAFSVFLFVNNNYIAPATFYKSKDIIETKIMKKKKTKRTKPTRMWIKHGSHICYIGVFDDKKLTAKDIKCVKINEQVDEILQAQTLKWNGKRWMGYKVKIWQIEQEKPKNLYFKAAPIDFFIAPFELKERKKQMEEMSTPELYGFIKDLKKEAIDASPYLTEMYSRIFLSISPVIMVILGFPLGLSRGRGKGSGAVIGIIKGLAISAAFWMSYYSFSYLGKMGWIPPIIATSLPLIIFLAVGKKFLEEVES